jgi:hypothetical protein
MAANRTAGSRPANDDPASHLSHTSDGANVGHPEVLAWFAEAKRLFVEAEERFDAGDVLPALSSLAAVPPVHRMLLERCSELLTEDDAPPVVESTATVGMYL